MHKHSLNDLVEFNSSRFNPRVLANEPGYRMVLLCLRAGQSIPEHATQGKVTVHAIRGHVAFNEGSASCELRSNEVVTIEPGALHSVKAHDDSVLLVLATAKTEAAAVDTSEELDLREVPRPQRHPLIFAKFDALSIGDSMRLLNDHDPVPLSRQFESIRPDQALWEYIERGPDLFRIRIRRIASPSPFDVPLTAPPQQLQIEPNRA